MENGRLVIAMEENVDTFRGDIFGKRKVSIKYR